MNESFMSSDALKESFMTSRPRCADQPARVAVKCWVEPAGQGLLVVPRGSLSDHLREALAHVKPALHAVDPRR
jgi:hypothetical protein